MQERSAAEYGLSEVSVSSSGEVDFDNLEETHQTFQDVALVMGDRLDKGRGNLLVTNR